MTKSGTKKETKEKEYLKVESVDVGNVRLYEGQEANTVFFTLILNGVTIYNCKVVEGKNGDFIAFPQLKANNGKYYNIAYAALSPEDEEKIRAMIQKRLDE